MEDKVVIFIVGSVVCVPVGIILAMQSRRIHDFVFIALVFGTAFPDEPFGLPASINFLSREWYRGSTRGIEISYLDLLAIILLVSSIAVRKREGRRFFWPPGYGPMLAFAAWCTIGVVAFAEPKIFGVFELTKIYRGLLLFLAVVMYVRSPREVTIFVWALIATMYYQAAVSLHQRYIQGMHRIRGTIYHANSLSMYSLQLLPMFIVTAFSSDITHKLRMASFIAFLAAVGVVILTISRTGFAAACLLAMISYVLCTKLQFSPRNIAIAAVGIILLTFMLMQSWDTVMGRLGGFDLEHEYFTDEGDRGGYFRRGAPAIRDNPVFGFGLNNWSYWISNQYAEIAGFPPAPFSAETGERLGRTPYPVAHNLFLLTVAETGWPGLLLLLLILARWMHFGIGPLLGRSETLMARVPVGILLSISGVLMQSWTEWIFRQTHMFFLGHVIVAVGAVLYYHRGSASMVPRRKTKPNPNHGPYRPRKHWRRAGEAESP